MCGSRVREVSLVNNILMRCCYELQLWYRLTCYAHLTRFLLAIIMTILGCIKIVIRRERTLSFKKREKTNY